MLVGTLFIYHDNVVPNLLPYLQGRDMAHYLGCCMNPLITHVAFVDNLFIFSRMDLELMQTVK